MIYMINSGPTVHSAYYTFCFLDFTWPPYSECFSSKDTLRNIYGNPTWEVFISPRVAADMSAYRQLFYSGSWMYASTFRHNYYNSLKCYVVLYTQYRYLVLSLSQDSWHMWLVTTLYPLNPSFYGFFSQNNPSLVLAPHIKVFSGPTHNY